MPKPSKHKISERSCIACRTKRPRAELLRFVCVEGSAVFDARMSLSGRGAWLCPSQDCFDQAVRGPKEGRLAKALKTTISLDELELLRRDFCAALIQVDEIRQNAGE